MSMQYVRIYYGPCNSFHTTIHKPQKLTGLRGISSDIPCYKRFIMSHVARCHASDRLQKMGYRVDLVPVEFIDYCLLEMCGHEVFRCNIQNLRFNTHYHRDSVCQKAVSAVVEATAQFQRARCYLWGWTLIDDLFKRTKYGPKEYWPFDVDIKPFGTCEDCIKCCGIVVQKKEPTIRN